MPPQNRSTADAVEFRAAHPFRHAQVNGGQEVEPGKTYTAPLSLVRRIVDAGHGQADGLEADANSFALKPGQRVTAFAAPNSVGDAIVRGSAGESAGSGARAVLLGEDGATGRPAREQQAGGGSGKGGS